MTVDVGSLPGHDVYTCNNGYIDCTLTVETPLYIRSAMSPDFFKKYGDKEFHELAEDHKNERARFFSTNGPGRPPQPVIPGSSLRGMTRSLLEIASFGKMQWVAGEPGVTFRAVAASQKKDPLAAVYRSMMTGVKAGYLEKKRNDWFIIPALEPVKCGLAAKKPYKPYLEVKDKKITGLRGFIKLEDPEYIPQYHDISFDGKIIKGKFVVQKIGARNAGYKYKGVLVCTGSMRETAGEAASQEQKTRRTTHVIVLEKDNGANPLKIEKNVLEDYKNTLTPFQKEKPFDREYGCLVDGRPVFYILENRRVFFFGHCPNFRIPAIPEQLNRAATPRDFVPLALRGEGELDMAEAIFGFAPSAAKEVKEKITDGRSGRVFFTDARLLPAPGGCLSAEKPVPPKVLSSPKPTAFQHYLTQSEPDNPSRLCHYASPLHATVIRGHKLYWHKGCVNLKDIVESDKEKMKRFFKQYTRIIPVKPGVKFTFRIYFENLKDEELGALLWVLMLPGKKGIGYRHKLGMGKPLGMGTVKIVPELNLMERKSRYMKLMQNGIWYQGDVVNKSPEQLMKAFESKILEAIDSTDKENADCLADTGRIMRLLKILEWPGPPRESTGYMELSSFKDRRVLPDPLDIDKSDRDGSL
ncbi:CRISPR-associated RAMP family protein [Desulfotomaculum copahuensis]|uniref:CRISPR-associated RAMP family protein n=1 Tax=Desulfotomaculum copahuensis TaxID=1838280 RepID=A0A1B7LJM7_9FIRM|nr:CRISPR-associated RAMP family protein [Desulfotomaculum copahuensis]